MLEGIADGVDEPDRLRIGTGAELATVSAGGFTNFGHEGPTALR
jgi:hypothetical protein